MKIRELYYRFKYRPKKGQDGATAVILAKNKKKGDFEEKIDNIARSAVPSYKTNQEVLQYLQGRYALQPVVPTERELSDFKVNYILNQCPEVLETPEIPFSENGKMPGRSAFLKQQEIRQKRFEEARQYPFEQLGLHISVYSFVWELPGGSSVVFQIICENTKDELFISASAEQRLQESDDRVIQEISDEITVYRGVKQEDIDNRTKNFILYAAAKINLEKRKETDKKDI